MNRNIWIAANLVPDNNNVVDKFSKELNDLLEQKTEDDSFEIFFKVMYLILELNLFASRLNKQIFLYISWKPFSDAKSINVFFF